MSITDDSNESNIKPSCSIQLALVKATYNDYFSISEFTLSLTSLSKEIQFRAICAPSLPPCYFAIIHKNVPAGATCIHWNAANILDFRGIGRIRNHPISSNSHPCVTGSLEYKEIRVIGVKLLDAYIIFGCPLDLIMVLVPLFNMHLTLTLSPISPKPLTCLTCHLINIWLRIYVFSNRLVLSTNSTLLCKGDVNDTVTWTPQFDGAKLRDDE